MDQLKAQIAQISTQLNALQSRFDALNTLPGITQDFQGSMADRLFQKSTASPTTYTKFISGSATMVVCDGFYELENGLYVPFYRRVT